QCLDLVKRSDPLEPGLLVRLDKVWMNAVVNRVAGHDQFDGGDIQAGRVGGISMTDLLDYELLSFQFELAAFKHLGRDETFRDLAREAHLPEALHKLRRDLIMHR